MIDPIRRDMQSRKAKSEPNITEAAEKTGQLIRGLQSRLLEGAGEVQDDPVDTAANLERQLQEYFATYLPNDECESGPLNRIRNRVIDGVAERILRDWQTNASAHPFENEVVDRLIDVVMEMMVANGSGAAKKARRYPSV